MRKTLLVFISALLLTVPSFAQELDWESDVTTYAVVVGISDYQDEQRTDLKYAHRDAITFADFLQSKTGGETPAANIKLLTNEAATLAAIDDALNWLLQQTQKGQRAIVYFSGHGDVEKQTLWQLGYLLAYDTPFNNYRNNAVRLEDLNDLVTTLSVGREAEVIVITDACRSGKLAGSDNRGPSLTAEQMAKQAANEVRIMSCKPDQKSFEGMVWGGGRGVFSWHFINGLKGLADEDADLKITREEIEFYLRDKFRDEQRNQTLTKRQTPQFTGNELLRLSSVHQEELAALEMELSPPMAAAEVTTAEVNNEAISERGGDDEIDVSEEENILGSPFDVYIGKALDGHPVTDELIGGLFEYTGEPFDSVLQGKLSLMASFISSFSTSKRGPEFVEAAQKLRDQNQVPQTFKNQFAIALHNRAQITLNEYLKGEAKELKRRYKIRWGEEYVGVSSLLAFAESLLEPTHPLTSKLKVKFNYFDGVLTRLLAVTSNNYKEELQKAIEMQEKALQLDDKAPYIHNELGLLHLLLWNFEGAKNGVYFDKAKQYLEQAIDLSPTWVLPYSNLGGLLAQKGETDKAKKLINKATSLRDDYFGSFVNLGFSFEQEGNYLRAETNYRKAIDLAPAHFLPFDRLAYLSLKTGDYHLADSLFNQAEIRRNGMPPVIEYKAAYKSAVNSFTMDVDHSERLKILLERIKNDSLDVEAHYEIGVIYAEIKEEELAEKHFKTVLRLAPNHAKVYNDIGMLFFRQDRYEEAEVMFQKMVEMYPDSTVLFFKLSDLYSNWNRFDSEEKIYRDIIEKGKNSQAYMDGFYRAYRRLSTLLEKLGRFREAELVILDYIQMSNSNHSYALSYFYQRMMERYPEKVEWVHQQALLYFEDEYNISENIALFKKVSELETDSLVLPNIYQKIGILYIKQDSLEQAAEAFETVVNLAPDRIDPAFQLVQLYHRLYRYFDALPILEKLNRKKEIDFSNRLLLADYYSRMGKYKNAESLLKKATAIQPLELKETNELFAQLYRMSEKQDLSIEYFKRVNEMDPMNGLSLYSIATIYAESGQQDEALAWLEQALEKGFNYKKVLVYDPDWKGLRADERFNSLMLNYNMN